MLTLFTVLPKHANSISIRAQAIKECYIFKPPTCLVELSFKRLKKFIDAFVIQLANLQHQSPFITTVRESVNRILQQVLLLETDVAKIIAGTEPELIQGQPALLVRSSLIAAELLAPLPNVPVVFDTSSSNPPDHVVLEGLGHPEGSDAVLPLGI